MTEAKCGEVEHGMWVYNIRMREVSLARRCCSITPDLLSSWHRNPILLLGIWQDSLLVSEIVCQVNLQNDVGLS